MKRTLLIAVTLLMMMTVAAKDIKTLVVTTQPQMHCANCENKIKEDTTATSRCMPFEGKDISDKCICCGKPAKALVYWGKAY